MKKLILILLAALLLSMPLAVWADGDQTPPPPPQEPEYDPLPEEYLSLEERLAGRWFAEQAGLLISLTLTEDGAYALNVPGQAPRSGQWTVADGQVLLSGEEDLALLVVDGVLRAEALDLLFTREQPLTYVPAQVIAGAGAFDGLWRAQFVAVGDGTMLADAAEEDAFLYIQGTNVALGGTRFGNVIKAFTAAPGALTLSEPDLSVKLELQQDGFLRMTLSDAVIYLMAYPVPESLQP